MQELWERTLELRIRAQKAMTMAHRLPKVRRNRTAASRWPTRVMPNTPPPATYRHSPRLAC